MSNQLTPLSFGGEIDQALAGLIGHAAPFHPDELSEVTGPLILRNTTDLGVLAHLSALEHLEIHTSQLTNLNDLFHVPHLHTLRIVSSPVEEITGITACQKLQDVMLKFTFVQDAQPLRDLPHLQRLVLLGNPWTMSSYMDLLVPLLHLSRPANPPLIMELSSPYNWQLTRELLNRGLRLCYDRLEGFYSALVRPCIPKESNNVYEWVSLSAGLLERALYRKSDWDTDALFDISKINREGSAFPQHREIGDAERAQQWLAESPLTEEDKEHIARFINRFPQLTFYRIDNTILDAWERYFRVTLPPWFRTFHKTLSYIAPNQEALIQFDEFDVFTGIEETIDEIWYRMELLGHRSDWERNASVDEEKQLYLFPVGEESEASESVLSVNLGRSDDEQVYEYYPMNLVDFPPPPNKGKFTSYASMLSHIVAIKIVVEEHEIIIHAQE